MTQELSSLMDGELDVNEADRVVRDCCRDNELMQKWQTYHLIGDAMRGVLPVRRPADGLICVIPDREPTVLAPRRRMGGSAGRIAFAAAASVATVAVVGWIGVQGTGAPQGPAVAKSAPAESPPVVANLNVNEYLVVHRQVPHADFYRPVSNAAAAAR